MADRIAYYKELNHKNKKLLKKHEKEIMTIYQNAFMDSYEELIIATMDDNKYNEKAYFKAKMAYVNQIYEQINELEEKYMLKASDNYKDCLVDFFDMESEFDKDERYLALKRAINKKVSITNQKVINLIKSGKIYEPDKNGNFVDLDNRLWNAANASGKKLQDAILSCFAQGMGPADMARVIEEFGKGGHRTWNQKKIREKLGPGYARSHSGGLDYPALRLARTTHTHSNQLRVIEGKNDNPYINKIKYHSVHSANRTCKMCIERDGQIFPINKVPLDHPNGMCWLEPVSSMTNDEIAQDLAKWIRGESNSGIMDKAFPELKDTPNYKDTKPIKKTTIKETKPKTKSELENKINEYITHWEDLNTQGEKGKKYLQEMRDVINKYPDNIKEAFFKINPQIKKWTHSGGAYWNTFSATINADIDKLLERTTKYGRGKYDTWFHENGHAMDAILGKMYNTAKGNYTGKVLSAQKPFINALKKDFENQKVMLKKKYLKEKGYNVENISDSDINQMIDDKQLNALYNHYLYGVHKTGGIQDIVEGMSNCKISIQWGHGKEYWNRGNREEEYASEAWANILGSYSDDETYEYMKEYFPNAMKMQQTLINKAMKEVTKK